MKMEVICPHCSQWREEEVSSEELSARMCVSAIPVDRECDPCRWKREDEYDLKWWPRR